VRPGQLDLKVRPGRHDAAASPPRNRCEESSWGASRASDHIVGAGEHRLGHCVPDGTSSASPDHSPPTVDFAVTSRFTNALTVVGPLGQEMSNEQRGSAVRTYCELARPTVHLARALGGAALISLLLTGPAFAYLDPGTGSLLLHAIIGAVAAGATALAVWGHRAKRRVRRFFGYDRDSSHRK
jgi:hypothetical protein